MIQWQKVIEGVREELGTFRSEGFKPTLRTMFYRLYSLGLVPNTKQAYKNLSAYTVEARWRSVFPKKWYVSLPIDCFADNSREVIGDINEVYLTPQALIDSRINRLQKNRWGLYRLHTQMVQPTQVCWGLAREGCNGRHVPIDFTWDRSPNRSYERIC